MAHEVEIEGKPYLWDRVGKNLSRLFAQLICLIANPGDPGEQAP